MDELSSDEQEANYSQMPSKEAATAQDLNLFKQITEDIDPAVMVQKQNEFDAM